MLKKLTKNFYLWTSLFVAGVPMYASAPERTASEQADFDAMVGPAGPASSLLQGEPIPERTYQFRTQVDGFPSFGDRVFSEGEFRDDIVSMVRVCLRKTVYGGVRVGNVFVEQPNCAWVAQVPQLMSHFVAALLRLTLEPSTHLAKFPELAFLKPQRLFGAVPAVVSGMTCYSGTCCRFFINAASTTVTLQFNRNIKAALSNDIQNEQARLREVFDAELDSAVSAELLYVDRFDTLPHAEVLAYADADPYIFGDMWLDIEKVDRARMVLQRERHAIDALMQDQYLSSQRTTFERAQMSYILELCSNPGSGWTLHAVNNGIVSVNITAAAHQAFLGWLFDTNSSTELASLFEGPFTEFVSNIAEGSSFKLDSLFDRANDVQLREYASITSFTNAADRFDLLYGQIEERSQPYLTDESLSKERAMIGIFRDSRKTGTVNPTWKCEYMRARAISAKVESLRSVFDEITIYRDQVVGPFVSERNSLYDSIQALHPGTYYSVFVVPELFVPGFDAVLRTASQPIGADSQPIGADSQPIGAASQPIGAASQPIGADSQPIGAASQPIGAASQPIGADSQPIGAASQPIGADSQPLGADPQPIGADSQPIGADSQPLGAMSVRLVFVPRSEQNPVLSDQGQESDVLSLLEHTLAEMWRNPTLDPVLSDQEVSAALSRLERYLAEMLRNPTPSFTSMRRSLAEILRNPV
jgi:hypothetical protein